MEKQKKKSKSKKSAQDKKNKQPKKTEKVLTIKHPEKLKLYKYTETFEDEAQPTNTKPYLPTIFLHFIIGLLKNKHFEYPTNIGTIDEMVNARNYNQLLQPFYANDLTKHFVFQETEYNTIPDSRYRDRIFIYNDKRHDFYYDNSSLCKMSDMGDKYSLPDFKDIKNSMILFLNKESETATENFLEKYISDFEHDKLSPKGDYYPFEYQDEKMQELILNLNEIYPKTKKIKVSYDMSLLNDKRFRLPEMLYFYSMKKYISIDEVSINPKDLYFKISILKIPKTKEISHNVLNILEYKGLSLDVKTGRVEYNGKEIKGVFKYLNTEKFYILEILLRNPGKLIYINELKRTIASRRQRRKHLTLEQSLKTTIDRLKRDLRMTKPNKQTQLTISLIKAHRNQIAIQLL